jgi:hypothetical protein
LADTFYRQLYARPSWSSGVRPFIAGFSKFAVVPCAGLDKVMGTPERGEGDKVERKKEESPGGSRGKRGKGAVERNTERAREKLEI